eukprot:Gb_22082 [translate_table: standard]
MVLSDVRVDELLLFVLPAHGHCVPQLGDSDGVFNSRLSGAEDKGMFCQHLGIEPLTCPLPNANRILVNQTLGFVTGKIPINYRRHFAFGPPTMDLTPTVIPVISSYMRRNLFWAFRSGFRMFAAGLLGQAQVLTINVFLADVEFDCQFPSLHDALTLGELNSCIPAGKCQWKTNPKQQSSDPNQTLLTVCRVEIGYQILGNDQTGCSRCGATAVRHQIGRHLTGMRNWVPNLGFPTTKRNPENIFKLKDL